MSFASVMVYVDPEQQEKGQIAAAAGIAGGFGATILGTSAIVTEPQIVAEGVIIQDTIAEGLERIRVSLSAKEAWFRRIVRLPSEKVESRSAIVFPTEFLVEQARAADLIVVKRKQPRANNPRHLDPAGAMLRMGRPTLSVPDGVQETRCELRARSPRAYHGAGCWLSHSPGRGRRRRPHRYRRLWI